MQRNPIQHAKKRYFDNISIKKIKPLLFYTECNKCGMEYKRETMYECQCPLEPRLEITNYVRGCSHCFTSKNDFRDYLENNNIIYTDETYDKKIPRYGKKSMLIS